MKGRLLWQELARYWWGFLVTPADGCLRGWDRVTTEIMLGGTHQFRGENVFRGMFR